MKVIVHLDEDGKETGRTDTVVPGAVDQIRFAKLQRDYDAALKVTKELAGPEGEAIKLQLQSEAEVIAGLAKRLGIERYVVKDVEPKDGE